MIDLLKYFPRIYQDIPEIKEIVKTENADFEKAKSDLKDLVDNQFIFTANEYCISYMEKQIGIIANPEIETLEYRRLRLLNRVSTQPPFTTPFLRQRLDDIIGKDEYTLTIDYPKYTIYIESIARNQTYNHEIAVTMNMVKPANMIFINVPTIISPVLLGETVSSVQLDYNYKLGTKWVLGRKPFISYKNEEVVKVAQIPSITPECLSNLAEIVSTKITKAIINDSLEITDFMSKSATETGDALISYKVLPSSGISVISNVKLVSDLGDVYFDSNIYVPVGQELILKHTIRFKEG